MGPGPSCLPYFFLPFPSSWDHQQVGVPLVHYSSWTLSPPQLLSPWESQGGRGAHVHSRSAPRGGAGPPERLEGKWVEDQVMSYCPTRREVTNDSPGARGQEQCSRGRHKAATESGPPVILWLPLGLWELSLNYLHLSALFSA
uniref:Uncharacterized protein n=1 Tax=Molossus molossus TaxID=27622 RepID=A0A7J8BYH8_MOLMO|nr:hypothetical protein HJG59_010053 [Molossus molossus]